MSMKKETLQKESEKNKEYRQKNIGYSRKTTDVFPEITDTLYTVRSITKCSHGQPDSYTSHHPL